MPWHAQLISRVFTSVMGAGMMSTVGNDIITGTELQYCNVTCDNRDAACLARLRCFLILAFSLRCAARSSSDTTVFADDVDT